VRSKRGKALRFLRERPEEFLELTLKRMAVFWNGEAYHYLPHLNRQTQVHPLEIRLFAPFSLLAGLGFWLAIRRKVTGAGLFLATVMLYPSAYYVTFSQPRYRHAIEPVMLIVIVYLLREGGQALRLRRCQGPGNKK
jgi:hypothetical protein